MWMSAVGTSYSDKSKFIKHSHLAIFYSRLEIHTDLIGQKNDVSDDVVTHILHKEITRRISLQGHLK